MKLAELSKFAVILFGFLLLRYDLLAVLRLTNAPASVAGILINEFLLRRNRLSNGGVEKRTGRLFSISFTGFR